MRLLFWNIVYKISWRVTCVSTKVADYASKRYTMISLGDEEV